MKKRMFAVLVGFCALTTVTAQQTPKITKQQPYKVPTMSTVLAGNKDSSGLVYVADVYKTLSSPLYITDKVGNKYQLLRAYVVYKQKVVTLDEQTNKTSTYFLSKPIETTQWPIVNYERLFIAGNAQAGETISIVDIIVKDQKGRVMYAPNLLINIK